MARTSRSAPALRSILSNTRAEREETPHGANRLTATGGLPSPALDDRVRPDVTQSGQRASCEWTKGATHTSTGPPCAAARRTRNGRLVMKFFVDAVRVDTEKARRRGEEVVGRSRRVGGRMNEC